MGELRKEGKTAKVCKLNHSINGRLFFLELLKKSRSVWSSVSLLQLPSHRANPDVVACPAHPQMSTAAVPARSQRSLKRLLDEPPDGSAPSKQGRQAPQPASSHRPACLGARRSSHKQPPPTVGQYTLLEHYEGQELYRAEHSHTHEHFTCQVFGLQNTSYRSMLERNLWISNVNRYTVGVGVWG